MLSKRQKCHRNALMKRRHRKKNCANNGLDSRAEAKGEKINDERRRDGGVGNEKMSERAGQPCLDENVFTWK